MYDAYADSPLLLGDCHGVHVQVKLIDFGFATILKYDMAESFLGTGKSTGGTVAVLTLAWHDRCEQHPSRRRLYCA